MLVGLRTMALIFPRMATGREAAVWASTALLWPWGTYKHTLLSHP